MNRTVAIGIDLGGTNCRGALVSDSGQVHAWRSMKTDSTSDLDDFLDRLLGLCRELLVEAVELDLSPVGIGCGAAGLVNSQGAVVSAPNLQFLNGFALQDFFADHLGLPVLVINDANALAWGEAKFGAGQHFQSFLTVTLGTGVGGGLVIRQELWQGVGGGAGEFGHLAVEAQGRPCGCGSHGCLEQYASGQGIRQNYRDLAGEVAVVPDSEEIATLARRGDHAARQAFGLAGRYLGQAVAGVANLLNLEAVLFAGGLSDCLDLLLPSLEKELAARAFAVNSEKLQLVTAQLGEHAGIVGAARRLLDQCQAGEACN